MSKWVSQFRSKMKKMLPHSRKMILDETYDIRETLGEGVVSVVKKAVHKKTGELFAIKIYDKNRLTSYDKDCMNREVELLKSLKHPNIVMVKGCTDTRGTLYLIEEFMSGGDLLELIRKRKVFPEKDARKIFAQILSAIAYLHSNGIVHRDIKPDNILLVGEDDSSTTVKLADFGFAKRIGNGILYTPCGSPVYTAPEIAREESYDKSVDVWSAGVLLYILLCGYPPFYHRDPEQLFEEIKKGVFDFPKEQWGAISSSAKELVSAMLKPTPSDRITAQQAVEHPWITKPDSPTSPPSPSPPSSPSLCPKNRSPSSSPPSHTPLTTTTTASAADLASGRRTPLEEKIRKVMEGSQFTLGPATSSPLWLRRHNKQQEKTERTEKNTERKVSKKGSSGSVSSESEREKEKEREKSEREKEKERERKARRERKRESKGSEGKGEESEKAKREKGERGKGGEGAEKEGTSESGSEKKSDSEKEKRGGEGTESEERSEVWSFKDEALSYSRSNSVASEEFNNESYM